MNRFKRVLFLLFVGLFFLVANGCQADAEEAREDAEHQRQMAEDQRMIAEATADSLHVARQLAEATIDSLSVALARCQAEE